MIPFLAKLVPFRDYFYAAIVVAAVIWYNVHVHGLITADEHKRDAAVAEESVKVQTAALAREAQDIADYTTRLKKANDDYATRIQADGTAHAADIARLRQLAAGQSGGSAALHSAPSTGTADGPIGTSDGALGYVPAELGAELADALRATAAQRDLCYADRDSLTGK